MTFDAWIEKADSKHWVDEWDAAKAAWDHQQQRISAHNERCEQACGNIREHYIGGISCEIIGEATGELCMHCPRRWMIED